MKKIVAFALAALMVIVMVCSFTSCGYNTLDDIKKNGKLVVYTEAGFAPYEFISDNKVVGVDIEIMKMVAEKIGVDLDVQDVKFDTIIGAVKSGKADVGAAGITITEERKKSVSFSDAYSSTEQYVIVSAAGEILAVEDLAGKKIGVQEGTTSDIMIEGLIKDGTIEGASMVPYTDPATAAVGIGTKVDAVVTDKLTAQNIVNASKGALKTDKLLKKDGSDASEVENYGMTVHKGNDALMEVINTVIAECLANGKISEWEKYYSDLYKAENPDG